MPDQKWEYSNACILSIAVLKLVPLASKYNYNLIVKSNNVIIILLFAKFQIS